MLRWIRSQGFILYLFSMVLFAAWRPGWGVPGGILQPPGAPSVGIFIIFLLQGLTLPTERIRTGLLNLRLHSFVQIGTFLLYPALGIALVWGFGEMLHPLIKQGVLMLCILPTTIASAAAFTSQAEGDVAGAIFNSVLSNLLGIFLVPLWALFLFSTQQSGDFPVAEMILKLLKIIALPLFIGQLIRPRLVNQLPHYRLFIRTAGSAIIAYIVYCAFCASFSGQVWIKVGWSPVIQAVGLAVAILCIVLPVVAFSALRLIYQTQPRIAAFFCASQKSLATGIPMASVVFAAASPESLGLILLPILIFHPFQLLIGAALIPHMASIMRNAVA